MNVDDLVASLDEGDPPAALAPLLRALWLAARGDWDGAHAIAQVDSGRDGAWVHAYLHRKEGDAGNAAYWYGRAGQSVAQDALDVEWRRIADSLLGGPAPAR